jgi:type II secretory pathway predicted ATPase ExeA
MFDRFPRRHNLILFGQNDLMLRLSYKNYEDIKSRITYSKELKRISDDQLMEFIQRETKAVRLPKNSFEDAALELILRSVNGNLRLCANLCYGSLLEACRIGERIVDHSHVNSVLIQPHWRNHEELLDGGKDD